MITVVFGKPGAGKTAYMVADLIKYLNRSNDDIELYNACIGELRDFNASGDWHYELPEHAPVYSNFPVSVRVGYKRYVGSYYIDGFRMGFANENVFTLPVLPHSRIYLSEAQRYYDSKKGRTIPGWVSRWYEEHRHFDLNIFLDTQRPMLLNKNIRELVECFVYIDKLEHRLDAAGNIVQSEWSVLQFDDWKFAQAFIDNGDEAHAERLTVVFDGNVFEHYESRCYKSQFLPSDEFSTIQHIYGVSNKDELNAVRFMYSQTAPDGYWVKE